MLRALVALFLLTIVACGQNEKTNDQGSEFLLPWAVTDSSELTLQRIRIPTLRNPSRVEGPAARVFIEAGLDGQNFTGDAARPRWIKSGSLLIPHDVKSGQAVTLYALFEKIWMMDNKLGIAGHLRWPRQVSLGVPGLQEEDNAFYAPEFDVTVVLKYAMDNDPMAINQGLMGHEHFHAHFAKVFNVARTNYYTKKSRVPSDAFVLSRLSPSQKISSEWSSNEHNAFLMSAFDEGLADFFAFVYSSNVDFLANSMASAKGVRKLDKGDAAIFSARDWEMLMTNPYAVTRGADCNRHCRKYILGTRYARQIYQLSMQAAQTSDSKTAREAMARYIIKKLPEVAEKFADAEMRGEKIEPQSLMDWLVKK